MAGHGAGPVVTGHERPEHKSIVAFDVTLLSSDDRMSVDVMISTSTNSLMFGNIASNNLVAI